MKIKTILLTGDDGYNSIGTRLLVHILKDKYQVAIAATRDQQSATGGKLSLQEGGGEWGKKIVDGVEAIWVSGTPADAIECADAYFKIKFDLVISGINLGANIGGTIASGTVAAAQRALNINLTKKSIALSWDLPANYWYIKHDTDYDLKKYHDYPGQVCMKVLELAFNNNFWQSPFLNINFPIKKSNVIRFTKPLLNLKDFYPYPVILQANRYSWPKKLVFKKTKKIIYDVDAIQNGYVSISPLQVNMLKEDSYFKYKRKLIKLR